MIADEQRMWERVFAETLARAMTTHDAVLAERGTDLIIRGVAKLADMALVEWRERFGTPEPSSISKTDTLPVSHQPALSE